MSVAPATHSVRSTTGTGNSRKREYKPALRVGVWVVPMPVSADSAFLFSVGFSSTTDIFSLLLYLSLPVGFTSEAVSKPRTNVPDNLRRVLLGNQPPWFMQHPA